MRTIPLLAIGGGCLVAAWLGWHFGAARPAESTAVKSTAPVSSAPAPAKSVPQRTHYAALAEKAPDLRGDRSFADILALAEAWKNQPDIESRGELLALIRRLDQSELPQALAALRKFPPPAGTELLGAALARMAEFDGPGAMATAEKLSGPQRDEVRPAIIAAWAKRDPKAAWQWYLLAWAAAPEPRYQMERCFLPLIHSWAMQDPKGAMEACLSEENHGTLDPWAGFASLAALPERREEIFHLLGGIADAAKREKALGSALRQWSASDARAAAAWLDAAPDKSNHNLVWAVAERFGREDYRAATDWLWSRTPAEKREQDVVGMGLTQWAYADPAAAGEWLKSHPLGDAGTQTMASAWATVDMDRSLEWAARISEEKRGEALAAIAADAKSRGKAPDMARCAAVAGVSEEEFAKLMAKVPMRF